MSCQSKGCMLLHICQSKCMLNTQYVTITCKNLRMVWRTACGRLVSSLTRGYYWLCFVGTGAEVATLQKKYPKLEHWKLYYLSNIWKYSVCIHQVFQTLTQYEFWTHHVHTSIIRRSHHILIYLAKHVFRENRDWKYSHHISLSIM